MSLLNSLWVEKYRPKNISDYIFQNASHKEAFLRMIEEKSIPHLLLSGVQGTGKSSLALLLIQALDLDMSDVLIINSSDENSIDVMREKIKNFVMTLAFGDYKIVLLEEGDYISQPGQAILRRLMEEFSDSVRFILTCNFEHKIIAPLKSRFQHYHFKSFDKTDVTEYMVNILVKEKIKFKLETLDRFVDVAYPDLRKIINLLQQYSVGGILSPLVQDAEVGDYKFKMLNLLETGNWDSLRVLLCENVSTEEWEDVYTFLYNNLNKANTFKFKQNWEEGIVIIAEYLYKHAICADPEINFAACIIKLSQIRSGG